MSPRDAALMVMVSILWAFNFIASKYGVSHFPPIFFTALRFALLFLILLPFLRPVPHGQRMAVAGVTLSMGILHYAMMFTGLAMASSVSAVAIATQTQVPFAALLAMIFLKERVGWRRWTGILVAFAGVALMGFDPAVFDNTTSLLLVLAAAFTFAVNQVIASTIRNLGVFNMQAWMALASAPVLLALSVLIEQGQWQSVLGAGTGQWGSLLYTCVVTSVIGHGIVYWMLRRYPVSQTAPFMLLPPVLAVVFGILLWGDQVTWRLAIGGAMTIGGVAVITLRAAKLGVIKVKPDPES